MAKRKRRGGPPSAEDGNLLRCRRCKATWTPKAARMEACPECKTDAGVVLRCGSKLRKKPGERCYQVVKLFGSRCDLHGKGSLKGASHPRYDEGEWSLYVPAKWRRAFNASTKNPDRLEMRVDVGVLDARRDELLRRMGTGEAGAVWRHLRKLGQRVSTLLSALQDASAAGAEEAGARAWHDLVEVLDDDLLPTIESGASDEVVTAEIEALILLRSKVVRVEQLGRQQSTRMVSIEAVEGLEARFAMLVLKYVTDRRQQSKLIADLRSEAALLEEGAEEVSMVN